MPSSFVPQTPPPDPPRRHRRSARFDRNWTKRLSILEGVFAACGHRHEGFARAATAPSVAYYHTEVSPLFRDCLAYVTAAGKAGYAEDYSWDEFWPARLDVEDLLAAAKVDRPLLERLTRIGVVDAPPSEKAA